jgi:hypothetical protein
VANLARVRRTSRLRACTLLALAALAAPIRAAAAEEPLPDPAALAQLEDAESRVRALETAVERRCARLGIAPAPAPDPETLDALAAREAELRTVLRFLSARREVVRARPGATRALRRQRVAPGVPALTVRLGLDRPPQADPATARTLTAWLAHAVEVPRKTERPPRARHRIPLKVRTSREPAEPTGPFPDCPKGPASALPASGFSCEPGALAHYSR